MRRLLSLVLLLFGMLLLFAGCAGSGEAALAPASDLPAFLATAAARVRDAYRFAIANPDALKTVPCYCGCGKMGHTSNLTCFIQEGSAGATPLFDEHAAGCGICVDIAQDVKRLTAEGKQPGVIRQYIDATYSSFGPATDTPLPQG